MSSFTFGRVAGAAGERKSDVYLWSSRLCKHPLVRHGNSSLNILSSTEKCRLIVGNVVEMILRMRVKEF